MLILSREENAELMPTCYQLIAWKGQENKGGSFKYLPVIIADYKVCKSKAITNATNAMNSREFA